MTEATRFFLELYAGQTGILELRTFGPEDSDQSEKAQRQRAAAARLRQFLPVENGAFDKSRVAIFSAGCAKAELGAYFGVALRTPSAAKARKGDAAHCQTLTALYVDADFKYLGEAETRQRLATFPLPPSLVVNSGGGLHPYLLLQTPIDLQTAYDQARTLLRRLAYTVAAIVDTSVSEPTRVLRIPGTFNFKYTPPRRVRLEHFSDVRIDPAGLPLVEMAPSSSSGIGSGVPFRLPATLEIHERRPVLRDVLRSLQSRGVPWDGALAVCYMVNDERCRPPHDRDVVQAYLTRVWNLPDRADFVRTPKTGWLLIASLLEIGLSVEAALVAVRSIDPAFDPEASE